MTTETTVGNYFISNYPPYSFWKPEFAHEAIEAMGRPPEPDTPLGAYLHIPFCRKRCHFCYFRVYTDKNSEEIQHYVNAILTEIERVAERPFIGGRKPNVIYFGGGTPSFLSVRQLTQIFDGLKKHFSWDAAQEVTFECEPGTLTEPKLRFLRDAGVTRLSLGVEHLDPDVLERNGRAHGRKEIDRVWSWLQDIPFPQVNVDLIAGMMGETDEKWRTAYEWAAAAQPDSVTIYQMEIPYNTTIYREMKEAGQTIAPVADWETKRRWVNDAFEHLGSVGYSVNSTCTTVKDPARTRFLYRDQLFTGVDLIGLGVASFGHVNGTHYQNEHNWGPYVDRLKGGELPVTRALTPTAEERLIREIALRFKLGAVDVAAFRKKHGVDIRERFAGALERIGDYLIDEGDVLRLNREGLLKSDLLAYEFFLPEHRDARYT